MKPWLAMAALAATMLAPGPAVAQGSDEPAWSILEYDAEGNPISTLEGDAPTLAPPGPATAPVPEAGAAPPGREADEPPPRDFDKPHVPREIMVTGAANADVEALRRLDFVLIERLRLGNLGMEVMRLGLPSGMSVEDAADLIGREFPGLTVDTNDLFEQSEGPAEAPDYTRRLSGWGAVPGLCGQGLRLGMIDSFVDARAGAFARGRVRYRSFTARDREGARDDHGTGVAALLVGQGAEGVPPGLLPGAQLRAAGIFEMRDGRKVGNLGALLRAVDWLVGQRVQVANLSIAGSANAIMTIALNRALDRGVLMVAAAGNRGPGAPPAWPAAHPRVIAVTALAPDLSIYAYANRGGYIDFAAPGVDVRTLGAAGPTRQSGTSFAAPFVTAMAAVHLLAGFKPDSDLIRASLRRYAVDLGAQGADPVFGHGLVRLRPPC